jgi:hypothetical protein
MVKLITMKTVNLGVEVLVDFLVAVEDGVEVDAGLFVLEWEAFGKDEGESGFCESRTV